MRLSAPVGDSPCHQRLPADFSLGIVDSRIGYESSHTWTTVTPRSERATADGFVASRVTARIENSAAEDGSLRIAFTTEAPWFPVAPKTTRIFLADITFGIRSLKRRLGKYEECVRKL